MFFNKTTNFSFKKYGECFSDSKDIPSSYHKNTMNISNKSFNTAYKFKEDIYLNVDYGYGLLVIYDELNKTYFETAIHRCCKVNANTVFNIVSITNKCIINIYTISALCKPTHKVNKYQYTEINTNVNVKKIVGCYNDFKGKSYDFAGEKLICYELTYVLSGRLYMTYDKQNIILNDKDCILFAPNDYHTKATKDNTCQCITIVFEMDIDNYSKELICHKIFNTAKLNQTFLLDLFTKDNTSIYDNALMITYSQLFILNLLKSINDNKSLTLTKQSYDPILDEMIMYISNSYDKISSVADLCNKFYFCRSFIQKLFNDNLGVSPKKYILNYQMNKAKQYFKNSDLSVNDVASLVGFTDQHHFSKTFKKQTGMAPSEYKKEVQLHHI